MKNLKEHFEIKPSKSDVIILLAIFALVVVLKLIGVTEIPENSLVENFQLIILGGGGIYCLLMRAKNPEFKALNTFFALILFLMFLREISYGRCIFCRIDGNPHEFYRWSHYKYGYLAHVVVGLYIASIAIYGIINKLWFAAIKALKTVKFPVVSTLLAIGGVACQLYAEKVNGNTFIEEIAELAIYLVITAVIYYYNSILQK